MSRVYVVRCQKSRMGMKSRPLASLALRQRSRPTHTTMMCRDTVRPAQSRNRQLKPTCKKIGLTGVGWHWLRHANATLLDAVGTPLGTVQALLGHSSSEMTRDVYLHSIPAQHSVTASASAGLHTVRIEAKSQKPWSREISLTAGGKVPIQAV
jgi:integrase